MDLSRSLVSKTTSSSRLHWHFDRLASTLQFLWKRVRGNSGSMWAGRSPTVLRVRPTGNCVRSKCSVPERRRGRSRKLSRRMALLIRVDRAIPVDFGSATKQSSSMHTAQSSSRRLSRVLTARPGLWFSTDRSRRRSADARITN